MVPVGIMTVVVTLVVSIFSLVSASVPTRLKPEDDLHTTSTILKNMFADSILKYFHRTYDEAEHNGANIFQANIEPLGQVALHNPGEAGLSKSVQSLLVPSNLDGTDRNILYPACSYNLLSRALFGRLVRDSIIKTLNLSSYEEAALMEEVIIKIIFHETDHKRLSIVHSFFQNYRTTSGIMRFSGLLKVCCSFSVVERLNVLADPCRTVAPIRRRRFVCHFHKMINILSTSVRENRSMTTDGEFFCAARTLCSVTFLLTRYVCNPCRTDTHMQNLRMFFNEQLVTKLEDLNLLKTILAKALIGDEYCVTWIKCVLKLKIVILVSLLLSATIKCHKINQIPSSLSLLCLDQLFVGETISLAYMVERLTNVIIDT